jgi:hypothetical protein
MTDKQRELKRERDRRYRERKRQNDGPKSGGATLEPPSSTAFTRAEVRDIIRTEIRLRHRHQAAREMAVIEAKINRRLDDCSHFGGLEIRSFQDVETLAGMTRRELFALYGRETSDEFIDYREGE